MHVLFINRDARDTQTNIGIFVDATYDIGRIEDVHWNPWFSVSSEQQSRQRKNALARRRGASL